MPDMHGFYEHLYEHTKQTGAEDQFGRILQILTMIPQELMETWDHAVDVLEGLVIRKEHVQKEEVTQLYIFFLR